MTETGFDLRQILVHLQVEVLSHCGHLTPFIWLETSISHKQSLRLPCPITRSFLRGKNAHPHCVHSDEDGGASRERSHVPAAPPDLCSASHGARAPPFLPCQELCAPGILPGHLVVFLLNHLLGMQPWGHYLTSIVSVFFFVQ